MYICIDLADRRQVMISGAPPLASAENNEQLHHTLGDYRIPQKIFSQYEIHGAGSFHLRSTHNQ
jgi:TPP-dependent 2-oxoacid decarboxylase